MEVSGSTWPWRAAVGHHVPVSVPGHGSSPWSGSSKASSSWTPFCCTCRSLAPLSSSCTLEMMDEILDEPNYLSFFKITAGCKASWMTLVLMFMCRDCCFFYKGLCMWAEAAKVSVSIWYASQTSCQYKSAVCPQRKFFLLLSCNNADTVFLLISSHTSCSTVNITIWPNEATDRKRKPNFNLIFFPIR